MELIEAHQIVTATEPQKLTQIQDLVYGPLKKSGLRDSRKARNSHDARKEFPADARLIEAVAVLR